MTPAARISAAIDLMDRIDEGALADRVLAAWGRQNRYAGSKDRAAIADLVYGVLRRKRSLAALGGGEGGRALLLGHLREAGEDPVTVFGAGPYAPGPLTADELSAGRPPVPGSAESLDIPDWLWPALVQSLGSDANEIAAVMRHRAPVHLRVNLAKLSRAEAIARLAQEGVEARLHALSPSALEVIGGERRIKGITAYGTGAIELQDAASQAVADRVPLSPGQSLLDFCAGGGGKTLAIAARVAGRFFAHDAHPARMKDLPARAARAGATIVMLEPDALNARDLFDTVLVDAPCSGSGAWRRDPQGKWRLTPDLLQATQALQCEILDRASQLVAPRGHLVYATCSLLDSENGAQVAEFLSRHKGFSLGPERRFTPLEGGDGFYCAVLVRHAP